MTLKPQSPPISRSSQAHAGFQLLLLNFAIALAFGVLWCGRVPFRDSLRSLAYLPIALVSCVAILAMIPGILFYLAHRQLGPESRWLGWIQAGVGSLFLCSIYTDTIVYRLLGYHLNKAVLNVFLTPGSGDAVHLTSKVWITATTIIPSVALLQYLFRSWRLRRLTRLELQGGQPGRFLRPGIILLLVSPIIALDKGTFAWASVTDDQDIILVARPLPSPKPRLGHLIDVLREGRQDIHGMLATASLGGEPGQKFTYPKVRPELPQGHARPNILIVVLDSWRRDAFNEDLTPNLLARSAQARVFENHKSGGNGTRFGLFTMLYGLNGSYWFRALENGRTPVLIDTLQEAGYDLRVLSSASMNFPEFLQTAWAGMPREHVVDQFLRADGREVTRRSDVKDRLVAEAFSEWMEERKAGEEKRPYFGFILLDSPHQPYFNPGGPHKPALKEGLDYIQLGRTTEGPELETMREQVQNSYWNSVLYSDGVADAILTEAERVDREGGGDGTIVLVTGDHGEEFYENGYWGHTSNYTPEQVDVPMFVYGPGITPGHESRPTSHVDVSGSLLELLGDDPSRQKGWFQGVSLWAPQESPRARVVAGFADVGVLTPSGIFMFPLETGKDDQLVWDEDWKPKPGMAALLTQEQERLIEFVQQCHEFLEPLP